MQGQKVGMGDCKMSGIRVHDVKFTKNQYKVKNIYLHHCDKLERNGEKKRTFWLIDSGKTWLWKWLHLLVYRNKGFCLPAAIGTREPGDSTAFCAPPARRE